MKLARTLIIAALPLGFAVGCETTGTDQASIDKANATAMQAESSAKAAADAAQRAAADAARAARAAEAAAAEAKAAGDKADRAFRQGMRK